MPNVFVGLAHPWLQNALCGAAIVAVLAAVVGYFVVMRGASFATHALSQIGFAGAAGAVLAGIEPLVGLIAFSLAGAGLLGALASRTRASDVATALVLVCALGTGALFLALTSSFGSDVMSFLFGTIVGVNRTQVAITAVAALCALACLATIARPLIFATVRARNGRARRGVAVGALDYAFLAIVALAAAITVPIVGRTARSSPSRSDRLRPHRASRRGPYVRDRDRRRSRPRRRHDRRRTRPTKRIGPWDSSSPLIAMAEYVAARTYVRIRDSSGRVRGRNAA